MPHNHPLQPYLPPVTARYDQSTVRIHPSFISLKLAPTQLLSLPSKVDTQLLVLNIPRPRALPKRANGEKFFLSPSGTKDRTHKISPQAAADTGSDSSGRHIDDGKLQAEKN
jgi:hypothetical protein